MMSIIQDKGTASLTKRKQVVNQALATKSLNSINSLIDIKNTRHISQHM